MPTYRNIAGVWKSAIPWRNIGGVWKQCILWRNIGGVWKVVGGQMTVTAAPAAVSGSGGGGGFTNVVSSASTATPTGGIGPFTYDWEYVSGDAGITVDADAAASTTWRKGLAVGANASAVWRCKVTDSLASIAYSNNVTIDLDNFI